MDIIAWGLVGAGIGIFLLFAAGILDRARGQHMGLLVRIREELERSNELMERLLYKVENLECRYPSRDISEYTNDENVI
ncbi:MAG: hypothetical protein ACE5JJ_11290 [Nitrospinota bacterium]